MPHFQTNLKGHRLYPYIKRTANWRLVTIDHLDNPYASSFKIKRSWGRQSKAFERSISTATVYWLQSMAFFTIEHASFPNKLKGAQVVPLHKKNSQLEVGNYRPISILPVVSKFFERAINEQLSHYFENIFQPFLSAFRPGSYIKYFLLQN
jgi:retron-type reverse transcriptase